MKVSGLKKSEPYRFISVYDKNTEELCGKINLVTFDLEKFSNQFPVDEEDEEMIFEYEILPIHAEFISSYVSAACKLNFESKCYFLSARKSTD